MLKRRNIIIAITILLAITLIVWFMKLDKKEAVQDETVSWNEATMNFSRVSFFNTQKYRASLAIPDFWEGRYRLKDEGTTVVFFNIDKPQEPREIFRIKSKKSLDTGEDSLEGWLELYTQDNFQFVYKLSTANVVKVAENKDFLKMIQDVKYIVKSFSVK